ncbi:hypothetical protein C922_05377 [Plasmodium inui San Antonio 1]|uniref:Uncharacterized protein n=1 Tax=Plasmodium inui San Antonio 1 TaxID=1237626 RepID=W7AG20_9APIC|nr:hypothetical protein C922_05377 [Plasmodium inui San Antonio 1]EUD64246.1 hypothetical protein C922_05377 [Plasmodium inui San Antonio 1]
MSTRGGMSLRPEGRGPNTKYEAPPSRIGGSGCRSGPTKGNEQGNNRRQEMHAMAKGEEAERREQAGVEQNQQPKKTEARDECIFWVNLDGVVESGQKSKKGGGRILRETRKESKQKRN